MTYMSIKQLPNVKLVCDKCGETMNRYYTQGIFGKSYKGFQCTNQKCNHIVSRNELYKTWDLDYRESWHIDITEKEPIYNEHLSELIEGKTLEEITNDPYIFTSSTLNELSEIVKGIDKIFSPKRKPKHKFLMRGKKIIGFKR